MQDEQWLQCVCIMHVLMISYAVHTPISTEPYGIWAVCRYNHPHKMSCKLLRGVVEGGSVYVCGSDFFVYSISIYYIFHNVFTYILTWVKFWRHSCFVMKNKGHATAVGLTPSVLHLHSKNVAIGSVNEKIESSLKHKTHNRFDLTISLHSKLLKRQHYHNSSTLPV